MTTPNRASLQTRFNMSVELNLAQTNWDGASKGSRTLSCIGLKPIVSANFTILAYLGGTTTLVGVISRSPSSRYPMTDHHRDGVRVERALGTYRLAGSPRTVTTSVNAHVRSLLSSERLNLSCWGTSPSSLCFIYMPQI